LVLSWEVYVRVTSEDYALRDESTAINSRQTYFESEAQKKGKGQKICRWYSNQIAKPYEKLKAEFVKSDQQ